MKKRFLSALLSFCMLLTLLPAMAQAQEEEDPLNWWLDTHSLSVGGVSVTADNANDVLDDGKVSFAVKDGKPTLTLKEATIQSEYAGIHVNATEEGEKVALYIENSGTSSIESGDHGGIELFNNRYGGGDVTLCISGGTLNVTTVDENALFILANTGRVIISGQDTVVTFHSDAHWLAVCSSVERPFILEDGLQITSPEGLWFRDAFGDGYYYYSTNPDGTYARDVVIQSPAGADSHAHVYGEEWETDETYHWHKCTDCDAISGTAVHTEDSGTVTKEPTLKETGVKTFSCSVCGYVMRTEELPKAAPDGFDVDKNGVLVGYRGPGGDVVIPDGVTSIGYLAFDGCSTLTSVTIPNSVTSIDGSAFAQCTGLTSVTIPGSVTSIGELAFHKCNNLTNLTIQSGVTSIGEYAFWECSALTSITIPDSVRDMPGEGSAFAGCRSLTSITVAEGNSFYYDLDDVLYSTDGRLICYPAGKEATSYTIPEGTCAIGECAFFDSHLTRIDIPNSVTRIGDRAFCDCVALANVVLPESVTNIEGYAFAGCTSLTDIVVPSGVTTISEALFIGCSNLASVVIPDSVTSIESGAFWGCSVLTSVNIPDSVTTLADSLFVKCYNLNNVTVFARNVAFPTDDYYHGRFLGCPETMVVVYGYAGSTTQTYCEENNITFVPLSEDPEHTHSYGEEWETDETSHWHECECGDRADTAAHTENSGTVTKEPTEEEAGVKIYACSVCGYVMRTESIPATGGSVLGGLAWSIDATGKLTLAGEFPDDGAIWVASWSSEGRFLSAQVLTAQRRTVQLEPDWKSLKLMWLNGNFAPQCAAVAIEK